MNKWILSGLIFTSYVVYGFILNQARVDVVEPDLRIKYHSKYYDYKGVIHVMTSEGGGRSSARRILEIAQNASLSFVLFTNPDGNIRESSDEGYFGTTMALDGHSMNYVDSKILGLLPADKSQIPADQDQHVLLTDWLSNYSRSSDSPLLILAHPTKPGYEWKGDFPPGLTGMEVVNLKSVWQDAWLRSKLSLIQSLFIYPFNGQLALLRLYRDPQDDLSLWNSMNQKQKYAGYLGSHANARTGNFLGYDLAFPSYELTFSLASNHILLESELTGQFSKDRQKVVDALFKGQLYWAFDFLGRTEGFWAAVDQEDTSFPIGAELTFKSGTVLRAELPSTPLVPYEIQVIKDQDVVYTTSSPKLEYSVAQPGHYRVLVQVKPKLRLPEGRRWFPWITTNYFYIRAQNESK